MHSAASHFNLLFVGLSILLGNSLTSDRAVKRGLLLVLKGLFAFQALTGLYLLLELPFDFHLLVKSLSALASLWLVLALAQEPGKRLYWLLLILLFLVIHYPVFF